MAPYPGAGGCTYVDVEEGILPWWAGQVVVVRRSPAEVGRLWVQLDPSRETSACATPAAHGAHAPVRMPRFSAYPELGERTAALLPAPTPPRLLLCSALTRALAWRLGWPYPLVPPLAPLPR
jgi:hypothetical protein